MAAKYKLKITIPNWEPGFAREIEFDIPEGSRFLPVIETMIHEAGIVGLKESMQK